jgi:outer membrane receptor protein involved in Fe transport
MKSNVLLVISLAAVMMLLEKPAATGQDLLSLDVNVQVASTKGEKIFQTPSSVTILTKEQLQEYNFSSVAEAIQNVAGFAVYRTYLKRNLPTSRGIMQDHYANKVLVLINGIPSWNAVTGEGCLDRVNINDVERIEVLKGPASVLYGTNAYSGAVNIVLKSSKETQVGTHTLIGTDGTLGGGAYVTSSKNDFQIFASGNATDEYQPKDWWMGEDSVKAYAREHMKWNTFNLNAKYKASSFFINGYNGAESYLGVEPKFASGAGIDQFLKGYLIDYTYDKQINDKASVFGQANYDYYNRNLSRKAGDIERANIEGWRMNGLLRGHYNVSKAVGIEAGVDYDQRTSVEYRNYDTWVDTTKDDNNMKDQKVSEFSGYAQVDYTKDKFTALAGARFTNNEIFGGNLSSRATLVYAFNPTNSVKLVYGESFRAPSLFELYFETATKTVFGSTRLDPEKSRAIELAYLTSVKNFFIQALFYHGIYDNKIYRSNDSTLLLPDGTPNVNKKSIYTNGEEFTSNGIEIEFKYANPKVLNMFVNFGYLMGNDEDKDVNDNYNFKYSPEMTVALGVSKNVGKHVNLSAVFDHWGECEGPFGTVDAQSLLNFNLSFMHEVSNLKLRHTFSAKNLMDEDLVYPEYVRRSASAKNKLNTIPAGYAQMLMYTLRVTL